MTTFPCPDCSGTVSDLAESCPHCGLPKKYFPPLDTAHGRGKEVVDSTTFTCPDCGIATNEPTGVCPGCESIEEQARTAAKPRTPAPVGPSNTLGETSDETLSTCPDCGIVTDESTGVCPCCESIKEHAPSAAKQFTPAPSLPSTMLRNTIYGTLLGVICAVFYLGVYGPPKGWTTKSPGSVDSSTLVQARLKAESSSIALKFWTQFREDWDTFENIRVQVYLDGRWKVHPRNKKHGVAVTMDRSLKWAGTWMSPKEVELLKGTLNFDKVVWMETNGYGFDFIDD